MEFFPKTPLLQNSGMHATIRGCCMHAVTTLLVLGPCLQSVTSAPDGLLLCICVDCWHDYAIGHQHECSWCQQHMVSGVLHAVHTEKHQAHCRQSGVLSIVVKGASCHGHAPVSVTACMPWSGHSSAACTTSSSAAAAKKLKP